MSFMTSPTHTQNPENAILDLRAFRKCLGHYGTGVAVVTAQVGEQRSGMTINSFSALSLTPPLVMWSIRNESAAHSFFTTTPHFSINILAADQVELSGRFAQSSSDPFEATDWFVGELGEPLISGTAARLSCSLSQILPGGDHTIIIGQVQSFAQSDRTPLLFVKGEYGIPSTHPHNKVVTSTSSFSSDLASPSLMRLLSTVASQWIDEFDIDRAAENLSRSQSRALAWLSEGPQTLNSLRVRIGLTDSDLEDEMEGLVGLGYAQKTKNETFELTPQGHLKRDGMASRIRNFEASKLAAFDASKVAVFKDMLESLLAK
jgi:flavin reductase (DIM6/NTAB) family NADH-FMN oxidoreductase RutF/DNA-binding MarR family transcriptional regulator